MSSSRNGPRSALLLAALDAVPGRADEFEEWYTHVHLRDVMRMPGARAAQRFRQAARQTLETATSPYAYLTVYDVDDPRSVTAAHTAAAGTDGLVMSSAADLRDVSVHYYFPTSAHGSGARRQAARSALQLEFAEPGDDAAADLVAAIRAALAAATRTVVAEYRPVDQMFRRPPRTPLIGLVEARCTTDRLAAVTAPLLAGSPARPARATLFDAASPLVTSADVRAAEANPREQRARARAKAAPFRPWMSRTGR